MKSFFPSTMTSHPPHTQETPSSRDFKFSNFKIPELEGPPIHHLARNFRRRLRNAYESSDIGYALYQTHPIQPPNEDRPLIRAYYENESQMRLFETELERQQDAGELSTSSKGCLNQTEGNDANLDEEESARLFKQYTYFDFDTDEPSSEAEVSFQADVSAAPAQSSVGAYASFGPSPYTFNPLPSFTLASTSSSPPTTLSPSSLYCTSVPGPTPNIPEPHADTDPTLEVLGQPETLQRIQQEPSESTEADVEIHEENERPQPPALQISVETGHVPVVENLPADFPDKKIITIRIKRCVPNKTKKPVPRTKEEYRKTQFPCGICKRVFTRKFDLQRHTANHTGAKPFECLACSLAFKRADARANHWKRNPGCKERDEELALAKDIRRRRRERKPDHSPDNES